MGKHFICRVYTGGRRSPLGRNCKKSRIVALQKYFCKFMCKLVNGTHSVVAGHPISTILQQVDSWSTDPRVLGRNICFEE